MRPPQGASLARAELSQKLREKLAPAVASGVLVGFGAVLFGASPATGVLLGLADAALRPLAHALYADYRVNAAQRAAAREEARIEALSDGDGI